MAQVAGIVTKKNTKGEITHVTVGIKKHKEKFLPIFTEMGVIKKTKFQERCEGALSVEEFKESMIKFVKDLPWKK